MSCSIDGCTLRVIARGWCGTHYARWRRSGSPTGSVPRPKRPAIDRFLARVVVRDNGCWQWTGALDGDGYGHLAIDGKKVRAHRWSYEYHVEKIPEGLVLDHLCRNRACVNPAHLEPVTNGENVLRGDTFVAANMAKTHCPVGHPYDEANTYITVHGGRSCRACEAERKRRAA